MPRYKAGPGTPNTPGRNRNTVNNNNSKKKKSPYGTADPFPLGPGDQTEFGLARQALKYDYGIQRASLSAQAKMTRAAYKQTAQGIRADTQSGISEVGGAMADRGLIGSTVQTAGIQDVKAEGEAALGDAFQTRQQELFGVATSRLDAISKLRFGLAELAMRKAAQQRQMALQAFGSGGQNPWGY
jgi:hypothetical protein